MTTTLKQTWDLDTFFPGGSASPALAEYLTDVETAIAELRRQAAALPEPKDQERIGQWHAFVEASQGVERRLYQSASFLGCLTAQDVKDEKAKILYGRTLQIFAALEAVANDFDARIKTVSDDAWQALTNDARLAPLRFVLEERRRLAKDRLAPELETLATDLAVDGYHAWSTLYDTIVGRIAMPFEEDGRTKELSVGQAHNKFSHPDRTVRARLFAAWETAWGREAELISSALNNLAGFRLSLYRHRGWDSVLKEPLERNRMSEATLRAMWEAVGAAKPKLAEYLNRKAKLIGAERLDWYDIPAPVGNTARKVSYDEAADFIVEQFRKFSPRMADFARQAFLNGWIEVEDRPGKQPGGFCTDFPEHSQTRIFMTFGGDTRGVDTLAHELGHAFHADALFDMPTYLQRYPYNLAETASTFAEAITVDAAIRQAQTREEKLTLLESKLSTASSYLMNLHSRFIFEVKLYEARRKGLLSVEQLGELMESAQREGYADALGQYHPLFWASKGHFYGTFLPFYNFPYTFGYLFSAGIYARAQAEGPGFERKYIDLLRDTGRMTVEQLGARHLGADLTQPEFWLTGVRLVMADVDEFLRLTQ